MSKKGLSYEELVHHLENDDSELEYLSEDENGWELDDNSERGLDEIEVSISVHSILTHDVFFRYSF